MKLWLTGALCTLALAGPAYAQVAQELLGTAQGELYSEPFYKSKEGFWVLTHKPQNDGYRCTVNFITRQNTFAILGPATPDAARKNFGMIWFTGKTIPPATTTMQPVQITLSGNDPTRIVPAQHMSMPGVGNILILGIDVSKSIQEKPDSNEIAVQFQGKEVFRSKLVHLQDAYRTLDRCMSVAKK